MNIEYLVLVRSLSLVTLLLLPGCGEQQMRVQLSSDEILAVFSNVQDSAKIQDAVGTTAENFWFSDGRFENHWKNSERSGTVLGTWSTHNNERCVFISSGLPDLVGKEKCGPIYRQGTHYVSLNADGSVHALHTLTPLPERN